MEDLKLIFLKELQDLKQLIAFYDLEGKLLADYSGVDLSNPDLEYLHSLSENLKKISISKRQFNYKSIIISLYGSFERFIENCLIKYVDNINNIIKDYDNLPEAIQKNHLSLSLAFLNKIEQPRYNGPHKKEEVIQNLHACINIKDQYILNKHAFSQHSANFRLQVVDDSFSHIGILTISHKILQDITFRTYTCDCLELNLEDNIPLEESFQILNDLAERRNEVAHGVPAEILQNSILLDYITFFENYTISIIEVLNSELSIHEINNWGMLLGDITDVFSNGEVICVKTKNVPIKVGDTLIGKNSNIIVKTKILELKLDDTPVEKVDNQSDYEIGAKIENKFKKNFEVYLINQSH